MSTITRWAYEKLLGILISLYVVSLFGTVAAVLVELCVWLKYGEYFKFSPLYILEYNEVMPFYTGWVGVDKILLGIQDTQLWIVLSIVTLIFRLIALWVAEIISIDTELRRMAFVEAKLSDYPVGDD